MTREQRAPDSNLYVLEVRRGIILYLNQRTDVHDGWWWGTDEQFVGGPFESSELAAEDARRHADKPLNLILLNVNNFATAEEPSPSGNLIVVDTNGCLWMSGREAGPRS
jgi:hypothetical protein